MSKFKVGDRVAVYGVYTVKDGCKAKVIDVYDDGILSLYLEPLTPAPRIKAHPKQCRRIKVRSNKREFWVAMENDEYRPAVFFQKPTVDATLGRELVHVREIRKKK